MPTSAYMHSHRQKVKQADSMESSILKTTLTEETPAVGTRALSGMSPAPEGKPAIAVIPSPVGTPSTGISATVKCY
jgi:hypothetical protein